DLPDRIAAMDGEPRGIIEDNIGRIASYPSTTPGQRYLVTQSAFRATTRTPLKTGMAVPSDQPLFARALVSLQRNEFARAVNEFDALAARYPIEMEVENADATYALPEFAYASAKAGDPLKLEQFVDTLPPDPQFFALNLAKAYFEALRDHDTRGSLQRLQNGFFEMAHYLGRTPSMEYQYAEAAERLYHDTGDRRFREAALSYVHLMQRLQPWAAWAYAIEAELSTDPQARMSALVKGLFLDPLSPRLLALPAAELARARAALRSGNPFVRPQPSGHASRTDSVQAEPLCLLSTVSGCRSPLAASQALLLAQR
ncbi:MAG: hypothetical protein ACREU2_15925, partial [Steroidobacteraceae bacterium]